MNEQMLVLRSEIERALDDLSSNEEGMRFQGLAVVLAKQRWPDFIACERKKDLGADAIGSGKALACSLTATLAKIKSDAVKIKKNFDGITRLVFATPDGLTNTTARHWAGGIRKEFGYELVVMSREDIITSLMEPSNAGLCRTHLGLPVALGPAETALVQQVREAVSEVIGTWSVRLKEKPLIDLRSIKIEEDGRDAVEVFQLGDIRAALAQSRRIVIEAPAGRGKTTTLVQLAKYHSTSGGLTFLIDLPAWIQSGKEVLQFIGGIPAFQSRALNAEILARLYKAEHFSFLLNGWNEIAESDSIQAVQALRELERNFPAAGIVVATRTHHLIPPLPGALRVRLLAVNRTERARYLQQRLGARAGELRSVLDRDLVLDELTQTPLVLSEVTTLFEASAPIPKTKMDILEGVVRLHEGSKGHSSYFALPPVNGHAYEYLSALAAAMMEQGAVTITEKAARKIVSSVAASLRDAFQIATLPEPAAILNTLSAHHVLERVAYPAGTLRFEHQQFQEFYGASMPYRQLLAFSGQAEAQRVSEFTKRYMNEPGWTEPLRMVAEAIGSASLGSADDLNLSNAGALLIRMALKCDPVFAAELSYLCGPAVWKGIRIELNQRLRSMYQARDEHSRQLAVAGMLATGSEDFRDVIFPLLK